MDRQGHYYKHPRLNPVEAQRVKELGEVEYMRDALNESLTWIQENPLEFFKLTILRFVHLWFGPLLPSLASVLIAVLTMLAVFGIKRVFPSLTLPQRIILLTPLLTYPLIYYLVPYMPRYRTPIDWILFMLAGIEVRHWINFITPRIVDGQTIHVDGSAGRVEVN